MSISTFLTPQALQDRAGQEQYRLGSRLFEEGKVHLQQAAQDRVRAQVEVENGFWVNLWIHDGQLEGMCTCSDDEDAPFCDHMVAVGLEAFPRIPLAGVTKDWKTRLADLAGNVSRPRRMSSPYALVFVLRKDQNETWKIHPYRMVSLFEITDPENISNTLRSIRKNIPGKDFRVADVDAELPFERSVDGPLLTAAARLLTLSLEQRVNPDRIAEWLLLAVDQEDGFPLFVEDEHQSLRKLNMDAPRQARFQIRIDHDRDMIRLEAELIHDQKIIPISPEDLEIIAWDEEPWLMIDGRLLRLEVPDIPPAALREWLKSPFLDIPVDDAQEVLLNYFPTIEKKGLWVGDIPVKKNISREPDRQLVLSDARSDFQARLYFKYGDQRIPYDPELPETLVEASGPDWTITEWERSAALEEEIYRSVSSVEHGLKFGRWKGENVFLLRSNVTPVEFLMEHLPVLQKKGFEIVGEDRLRFVHVTRQEPTLTIAVSSGIDWFDVRAVVEYGSFQVELEKIRSALRENKKYIELEDGTIGAVPGDWKERYKHLFGMGQSIEGGMRFSRHHLGLVDQLLQEADRGDFDERFEQTRQKFLDFSGIEQRALPEGFRGELRPYQRAGYDWLHFLHEFRFGGILADDMGLGKTIEVLAFLQSLRENGHTDHADLLVLPRSLLINWQREAETFTPDMRVHIHHGRQREVDPALFDNFDLILTTYGTMRNDALELREYPFHYVILDESQAIKNPGTKTARAVRVLRCDHHLALTGTPVENSTEELWSQFAFLNPGLLGTFAYFKREFASPIENDGDREAAQILRKMVYPFILRRTKDQVAPELPPRTERILYTDMEPAQKQIYHRTRDFYRAKLLGLIHDEGFDQARMNVLEGLLRLRQISNHPRLVEEDYRGRSAKLNLLLDRVENLCQEGHKALIFSQFVEMLKIIRAELDEKQIPYLYMDGKTRNRQERVDEFQENPHIPLFLISLRAGGIGLNLTAADYVIHVDPWWNPAVEDQATDRTHRIGQDRPVFVYKLIARDTVEEKILQLQEKKKKLVDHLITTEASFFKSLTTEDIEVLFS